MIGAVWLLGEFTDNDPLADLSNLDTYNAAELTDLITPPLPGVLGLKA